MNPATSPDGPVSHPDQPRFKDVVLDQIAGFANVAQFVSFAPAPDLPQRFSRVRGHPPNHRFASPTEAIQALLAAAPDRSVNVRSFAPDRSQGSVFLYGLRDVEAVLAELTRLAASGLYTILNETIDVQDGGVSGVALADLLEFAPGDTPRCVEKPGTLAMPRELGMRLLEKVYGFRPALDLDAHTRVEFSLHPLRRGFREEHTILWEIGAVDTLSYAADIRWPNHFSRLIGDKTFGLLLADVLGLPVPRTTVVGRALAPFTLGTPTGSGEPWLRTCPVEPVPGRYTTRRGWCDPFQLLAEEDPTGTAIASVLAQEGVEPHYSGALVAGASGEPIIEGVAGAGDAFMQGNAGPEPLPAEVLDAVSELYQAAAAQLGPIRLEWVYDGGSAWVVQLHKGVTPSSGRTVYPGAASRYRRFEVAQGLEALRALVAEVGGTEEGILLVGNIGITSHFGDVLRKARIPSHIEAV